MSEQPHDADEEERTTVSIRRAPKLSAFIVVGALIGLIATLVVTSLFPADPEIGFAATFGYFTLFGVPIGAVLGALIALWLDRRSTRRSAQVVAGKLDVRVDEEPSPVPDGAALEDRNQDGPVPGSGPDDHKQDEG
ncbi:MAG TPA: hypothetical protein VFS93_05670 [Terrimesophilobacter sp.]|nr:hypothetical protein [Terrimesophilobacter sp.]